MKEVEYFELLRSSQDIVLREEIIKIKAKTRDYILSQIKLLENKYQQKVEELVFELQNLKQNYEQLQLKNQSYALIIQEQEYKSIQNKNFVTLEIVNQLLTQKIKQLLLKLKEHNIISDKELESQYHFVQKNISDIYQSNNDVQLCQIIQNQQQLATDKIEQISDNSKLIQGYNTNNQYLTEKKSQASQTLRRDAQRIKSSTIQRKSENIQRTSLTPNVTKEIFDFKKSIDELTKSKNNLENCNEYLKQQNKSLQMKLSQKQSNQTNNQTFVLQQNPKIITKFLKFDDILFKKVQSFSMADSFDLKQKLTSNRAFSARPRTSIPSTCRNKQIPQHQAYQILL